MMSPAMPAKMDRVSVSPSVSPPAVCSPPAPVPDVPAVPAEPAPAVVDDICPQPADWCNYAGATDTPKECGGVKGHYCSDIFGKAGFMPCDNPDNGIWGELAEICPGQCNVKASSASCVAAA